MVPSPHTPHLSGDNLQTHQPRVFLASPSCRTGPRRPLVTTQPQLPTAA